MAEFLKLAGDLVDKGEKAIMADPENDFLNKVQCTRLWRNLRAAYGVLEPSSAYLPPTQQKCVCLYKELYVIVMRADAILKKCSSEQSWLEAAIFYGDYRKAFQELSLQLQSCVESFHKLTQFLFRISEIEKPANVVDVAIRDDEADEDFRADVRNVMARLEEFVKQPRTGEKENHLANYLIDRQNNEVSHCRLGSDVPHVPKFYEVDLQHIESAKIRGWGGFGVVSEVEWLGLTCAQKQFKETVSMEAFVKEVCALVALNHPNVVKLLGYNSVTPKAVLLMELMPKSLSEYINDEMKRMPPGCSMPFEIGAAIDMMLQIAVGMEYLHGQAVVHRDLKSMNILVAPSSHEKLRKEGYADIKLTDFGLAKMKVYDTMEPTSKMLGSTKWIAPEATQKLPSRRIDWKKADTYSFAITCSEILAGQAPYSGVEAAKVCEAVRGGLRPELPSECPIYLSEFLEKCWDGIPEARPSFEEIVKILTEFKTCLLMGTEPEQAPAKATSRWENIWGFVKNIVPGRSPVVLPDPTDPTERERFGATITSVCNRLEEVTSIRTRLHEHLVGVQICHVQCEHLVQKYLEGLRKIQSMYDHVSPTDMLNLFRSNKLQQFIRSLDRLICSILAVEELLRTCGESEWKITALAVSAPLTQTRTYSIFGFYIWELYWNLFVIHHVMGVVTARRSSPQLLVASSNVCIQWCSKRCRLVLRSSNEDVAEKFLRADAARLAEDRRNLLARLGESSVSPSVHRISSRFTSPEAPIEDGLAGCLKKRLQSTSATADFVSHQDCYSIDEREFQFLDRVASGRRKAVYKSKWFGVVVALSVQHNRGEQDFQREVETLARVQHPNVVHFIGYGYRDNWESEAYPTGYIVMELVQDNLGKLISRNSRLYSGGPFPLMVAIDILLQIVEAMLHLHECGVVHRDLRPFNILVRPKSRTKSISVEDMDVYYTVKLTGFEGAAKCVDSDVFYDGSVRYMAPEAMKRPNEGYTSSVDVWSFGMTAYHIVSGKAPFEDFIDLGGFARKIAEGYRPRLPDGWPHGGLKKLIEQCWAQVPQSRPSFEQIRKELWALKYNEGVTS